MVEILTDALTLPETPVGLKIARLLLLSDLLHNTSASVRNASRYRGLLEGALPHIFESLQVAGFLLLLPPNEVSKQCALAHMLVSRVKRRHCCSIVASIDMAGLSLSCCRHFGCIALFAGKYIKHASQVHAQPAYRFKLQNDLICAEVGHSLQTACQPDKGLPR